MSAQFSRSSSARRDFPIPGSPTSSTIVPKPIRTGATDAQRTARSRSRSTNGSFSSAGPLRLWPPRRAARPAQCLHWLALSLDGERLERCRLEGPAPAREGARRDPDLVLSRAGHEARRERRRVAEHGVGPAEARANLAREDAPLAYADVHGERQAGVDDRAHRAQHPLLVVTERLWSARDEHDPPAVAVDVALEERHAMLLRRGLHRPDESVERIRGGLWPFRGDDLVRSEKRTNAIAAWRCSPSSGPISSSCARSGAGTATSSAMPSTAGRGSTAPRIRERRGGAAPRPSPRRACRPPGEPRSRR